MFQSAVAGNRLVASRTKRIDRLDVGAGIAGASLLLALISTVAASEPLDDLQNSVSALLKPLAEIVTPSPEPQVLQSAPAAQTTEPSAGETRSQPTAGGLANLWWAIPWGQPAPGHMTETGQRAEPQTPSQPQARGFPAGAGYFPSRASANAGMVQPIVPPQPVVSGGLFSMFRPVPPPPPQALVQQQSRPFSWFPFGNPAQLSAPARPNPNPSTQSPSVFNGLNSLFRPAPPPAMQQQSTALSWWPFGNRMQPAPPRGYNPFASAAQPTAQGFNPLSKLNPLRALNPLSVLNPFSALNPATAFNPLKALNPVNAFNPLYALNPINSFNPLNALNPVNAFNPMYLMNPINAMNPLNALNPLTQLNPLHRLNPLNSINPLNGLASLGGKYAIASLNATTLKNLLGLNAYQAQPNSFGFGMPTTGFNRNPPVAGGGFNPFSIFNPGIAK